MQVNRNFLWRCQFLNPFAFQRANEGKYSEQRLRYAIGDLEILDNGDTITHYGAGVGGYGSPLVRAPEAVLADIQDGLISVESAKVNYGVVLAANGRSIDQAATSVLRESLLPASWGQAR